MACHKCPACGFQYCDLEECPQCHGKGIKRGVKEAKLKESMEHLSATTTMEKKAITEQFSGHPSDSDHKNFMNMDR